jgi:dTDP-4-amino-4,6-dideoxygalactose transaminase
VALPFLPAYAHLGLQPEQYPNAFNNQKQILSLPLFSEMNDRQFDTVIQAVRRFAS